MKWANMFHAAGVSSAWYGTFLSSFNAVFQIENHMIMARKKKTILQSTLGGVKYYSSFDICSFHQREVQMGGILCGLKIIRLITPNQNEYVWYRSLIPGSVTFWYGSGSAIRTLICRVSDPDPHGSAFIWVA
jgi:hypothetical protein